MDICVFKFFKHIWNERTHSQCENGTTTVWFNSLCLTASHLWSERQHKSILSLSVFVLTNVDCSACFSVVAVGDRTDLQYFVSENERKYHQNENFTYTFYTNPYLLNHFLLDYSQFLRICLKKLNFQLEFVEKQAAKLEERLEYSPYFKEKPVQTTFQVECGRTTKIQPIPIEIMNFDSIFFGKNQVELKLIVLRRYLYVCIRVCMLYKTKYRYLTDSKMQPSHQGDKEFGWL